MNKLEQQISDAEREFESLKRDLDEEIVRFQELENEIKRKYGEKTGELILEQGREERFEDFEADIRRAESDFEEKTGPFEELPELDEIMARVQRRVYDLLGNERLPLDITNSETGEILVAAGRRITTSLTYRMATNYKNLEIDCSPVATKLRKVIAEEVGK